MKQIHLTNVYDVDYGRFVACATCAKNEEIRLRQDIKEEDLHEEDSIQSIVEDYIKLTGKTGEEYQCQCLTQFDLNECGSDCEIQCEGCGAIITGNA